MLTLKTHTQAPFELKKTQDTKILIYSYIEQFSKRIWLESGVN